MVLESRLAASSLPRISRGGTSDAQPESPNWLGFLLAFGVTTLPAAGIIFAGVGLVRSFTQPQLHRRRWQAIVGLLFGLMWLGGIFLLAF